MASSNKPTPRLPKKKFKSPHLLENSFDLDNVPTRPNSTLGAPLYSTKFTSQSSQSKLKRTRSNSSLAMDGSRILSTAEKLSTTPLNIQLTTAKPSPKHSKEIVSGSVILSEKKYSEETPLNNRKKNQFMNRMLSSNGWSGHKKSGGNNPTLDLSSIELKRHQSPAPQRITKKPESGSKVNKSKSQIKELTLGYSKSMSYGIIDADTPFTQRFAKTSKRNNLQTPVFIIDCEADLKEGKESKHESRSKNIIDINNQAYSGTDAQQEKNNNHIIKKKPTRSNSGRYTDLAQTQPVTLAEKKIVKSEKENMKEVAPPKEKERNIFSQKTPSFFDKKIDMKSNTQPATTKATNRKEEALSEIVNRPITTSNGTDTLSSTLQDTKPQILNVNTVTPKNYFVPKTTTAVSQRHQSPANVHTPRVISTQSQITLKKAEESKSIQPSKNSDFSFKMLYFKPIEDSKIDDFIRDINESQYLRKKNENLNKTGDKSRHTTEPIELAFATPHSSVTTAVKPWNPETNQKEDQENVSDFTSMQPKKYASLKKSLTIEYKNTSSQYLDKVCSQDSNGKPPKPQNSKVKEERQGTVENIPERALSPSFESKKRLMSAEKLKVKDLNIKIESKVRTTYSKLDKLLQEIKSNPNQKQTDEENIPETMGIENELFGPTSKGVSSSSSTNCSLSKSYAHTLMKMSIHPT